MMLAAIARLRRHARARRALGPLLLAVIFASLLLVRGHTVTVGCLPAPGATATADAAGMPPMQHPDWFATHPAHGENALAAPADSFLAQSDYFDENFDGTITQIDTAKVFTGDVVLWKWVIGSHTITSGTGSADPNSGLLFNVAMNSTATSFSYQFNNVGTFPFYCAFHELFDMKGVVVVTQNPAAVGPAPVAGGEGFVRSPWPNPARGSTTFRFAQSRAGRVRVTVLDAQGRRLATPLEGSLGPGTFEASWNGRNVDGAPAPAGVYFLRLEIPGLAQSRRVTIIR